MWSGCPINLSLIHILVEHAVHDDLLAPLMAGGDKLLEFLIGAETPVYQTVVDGVIAVGTALEQRADIDRRTAKLCRVLSPRIQLFESPGDRLSVVFMRAAAQLSLIHIFIIVPLPFVLPILRGAFRFAFFRPRGWSHQPDAATRSLMPASPSEKLRQLVSRNYQHR